MIIISEGMGGERLRMTVIFIIFGMRFIFYHHPNDGHNFPLRSAIREPSRNMYLTFAMLPSRTVRSRFESPTDNGAIYKLLAFFSAVYIFQRNVRRNVTNDLFKTY